MIISSDPAGLAVETVLFLVICHSLYALWRERGIRRPPGPRPIPFFGNVLQLREEYQHKTFVHWAKTYGDLMYARLFQQPVIIINSLQAAQDLLDKRSAIYSDRPNMILHVEFMGWDCTVTHMHHGERFRRHRRWIQRAFGEKSSLAQYKPLLRRETFIMLSGLIETPSNFRSHIDRMVTAIVVEAGFGHTITSMDDERVRCVMEATKATTTAAGPAAMIVDFFPSLKYLPVWMPGARWKRKAAGVRILTRKMLDVPLEVIKAQIASGNARPSFTASLLEELSTNRMLTAEDIDDIKGASGIIYAAGAETNVTTLAAFFLAMVLFPDALRKAQDEIDRVIGHECLPDFDDRQSLPYLEGLVKEVYRWHPAVPLSIPHRVMSDDQYRGYDIPEGATILPNIWAMTRDQDMYADPETFRPEQFIEIDHDNAEARNPKNMVFGFG